MANIRITAADAFIFVEGVRLPVMAWNATGGVNGASSVSISIVPTEKGKRLLPGSHVALFVKDPMRISDAGQRLAPDDGISLSEERIDFEDQRGFVLLFDGKVVSRGFQFHAGGRRSLQLMAKGATVDWEQTEQYWADMGSGPSTMFNTLIQNNFSGIELKWDPGLGIRSWILDGLSKGDAKIPATKTKKSDTEDGEVVEQSHFLEHLLDIVENFGNCSSYYSTERSRWRLTDRVGLVPTGPSLETLFKIETFSQFFNGQLQKLSGRSRISDLLTVLLDSLHHDWVEILAPSLVVSFPVDRQENLLARKDENTGIFARRLDPDFVVGSVIMKPRIYGVAAPSCNVIFPDQITEMQYNRNFVAEPTRQLAFPTNPFFAKQFIGITKLQPPILSAFADSRLSTNVMGSEKTEGASTPDGSRGTGDPPRYAPWNFITNEEKLRGVVYNELGKVPLAGTLHERDEADEDKRESDSYVDGILQAQFLKSRFQSRTFSVSGPLNLRPVPGFPVVVVDDSDAAMHIAGYLVTVSHSQDMQGSQGTTYSIAFPRELVEENFNAPVRSANKGESSADQQDTATEKYIVKAGDTLNEIGASFGMSPEEIAKANPELLGRAILADGTFQESGFDPTIDSLDPLSNFNLIFPGETVLVVPHRTAAEADSHAVNSNSERYPLDKETSEFGIDVTRFGPVDQPEIPAWFSAPWRDADVEVPAGLSSTYRTLLGKPVVAMTHPGSKEDFDGRIAPQSIPDTATRLIEQLRTAGDKHRITFIDRYTRRRMVTVKEYWSFLGAEPELGGLIYAGGPFTGFLDNFPFEKTKFTELIKKAKEVKEKADADPDGFANDPKNKHLVLTATRIIQDLCSGDLSYPMTYAEIYDAKRERAADYQRELKRKGAFRG